ncbi:MAG: four helix bundle protein [Dysgonamonadaceae bacterium]|jgi:four helix bundle protein|nr:four helix bundle protein [Dysgonamonadaceae bacterium]
MDTTMKNDSIVMVKAYDFALRIIKAYKFLNKEQREFVLSKQMLRSGTAIGALIKEGEHAQSKADFINKMNVALKEANETEYWLMLLKDSEYIDEKCFLSIHSDCSELIRILASIVKTTKQNNKN